MIRLLLVDDHRMVRRGIQALVGKAEDIEVIGECSSGEEAIDLIQKDPNIDVIAMDLSMPDMDGITATGKILEIDPNAKILGLSMHNEESYISKILKGGALGYVLKDASEKDLVEGIRTVNNGSNYFGEGVTEIMMSRFMKKKSPNKKASALISKEDLTNREREVLRLIAEERTNQEIADQLFISKRTVDSHRKHLLEKTGAKNTAGLVRFAYDNDLLE